MIRQALRHGVAVGRAGGGANSASIMQGDCEGDALPRYKVRASVASKEYNNRRVYNVRSVSA